MGVFRIARQIGAPIVPMTMVGAYEWYRTGGRWIRPRRIIVQIHPLIEMRDVPKSELEAVRDRVHALIAAPLREGSSAP